MRHLIPVLLFALVGCNQGNSEQPSEATPATISDGERVVIIGDSIIAHWDLPAWIVNVGIPGDITRNMRDRFNADVMVHRPTTVIIEGGVNDIVGQDNPDTRFVAEMADIAAASGARVILVSMLPAELPYWCRPIDDWNAELKALAQSRGYTYLDLNATMLNPDGSMRTELYFGDHLHPTVDGYAVMWPVLETFL